jgi:hypothetical protein
MPIQVLETLGTPSGHDQNRTSPLHIIVKTIYHREQGNKIESYKREKSNKI